MRQTTQELVAGLRKQGFRVTPQRMAIVNYIMNTDEHPSAEYIYKVIQKKYPMLSLSTVYKTLELLRQKRLVNQIEVNGQLRYDPNTEQHVNLVCISCGTITDGKEDELTEIQNKIAKKTGYIILRGSLDLFGYCSNCKSKFEK